MPLIFDQATQLLIERPAIIRHVSKFATPYLNPTWETQIVWRSPSFAMLMVNPLTGFGVGASGGFGAPTSVWSRTLTTNGSALDNYSQRIVIDNPSAGGSQVRVYVAASTAAATTIDNFSIGVLDTDIDTVDTPVELFISGVSGYNLSSSGTAISDWANLTFTSGQELVYIQDYSSSGGTFRRSGSSDVTQMSYKSATNSYATASASGLGFSDFLSDNTYNLYQIDARSAL